MAIFRLLSTKGRTFMRIYRFAPTIVDRERLTMLLFCYLPIMLLGVVANFLGMTQPSAPFFNYTHTLCLAVAAVVLLLFCLRKINIAKCLSAFTITGQSILGVEMIFCARQADDYYNYLIIANTVLLALNTMASLAAYLKKNTIFLAITTICIYIACAFIANSDILKSFIIVFAIAFLFVCLANVMAATTTRHLEASKDQLEKDNSKLARDKGKLEKDNSKLARDKGKLEQANRNFRREELELLQILHLSKTEVVAYLSLAAKKYDFDGTRVLFERLDSKSRHNLISNVEGYIKTRATDLEIIERTFPQFTPSEREICRLILQGRKLSEICLTLNKNESNINSQRANMRRKLGLQPSDNLQKQLQARMDAQKG